MKTHNILLLATLDTKGAEALYLSRQIKDLGGQPLLVDISMRRDERAIPAETSADEVARAGGSSLENLSNSGDMDANMETVIKGATLIASRLLKEGKIAGIVGIGGYTGSFVITSVMHSLPFGLPKIMVSSAAGMRGVSNLFIKTSDVMLFHSVVEIAGLSDAVRNVLDRAACALWAMLRGPVTDPFIDRTKAIAMTMMSPCEKSARFVRNGLEVDGAQVIGFHANGVGDQAMEEMVAAGLFRGVVDLAPGGVAEHLYGFMRDAGPSRLQTAGRFAIPQVVATCGLNHITPTRSSWPMLADRRKRDLDRFRTWMRATPGELRQISEAFALKLNLALGAVRVLIPLRGWSSIDRPGSPTYDPEEDLLFIRALKQNLRKNIEVVEVDANLEDPEFGAALLDAARELFGVTPKV
jgi:uncharacterized protein (UPF0261 family)